MADDTLMTKDDPSVSNAATTGTYGLFFSRNSDGTLSDNAGDLILEPDSFLGYSYNNDSRLSQYPQEAGAFQSYNKVDTPFDVRIRVTKSGSLAKVSAFIEVAEGLAKASDLNLYEMRTPERIYSSVNVVKVSHDHQANHGAQMVTMDIHLTEVRVTASAQYTNTTSPTTTGNLSNVQQSAVSDPKQGGTVQTQAPTSTQTDTVIKALETMPSYDPGAAG